MKEASICFRLLRSLGARRAFWLGGPLVLYVWTLSGPFTFDDIHLLLKTERFIRGESPRLDLFRFAPTEAAWRSLRSRGTYPWWSPEHHRIDFFRPVAEFAFYLDTRLFGRAPLWHRLVSFFLFAGVLLVLHRFFSLVSGSAVHAGIATFFFGVSQTVTQPVTFISNRSDLLVMLGVIGAAIAYWSAGDAHRIRSLALGICGFALALLSKESGVAMAGVVTAHALMRRRQPIGRAPNRTRTVLTIVMFLMGLAYLVFYLTSRSPRPDVGAGGLGLFLQAARSGGLYAAVWALGVPISLLLFAPPIWTTAVATAGGLVALIVIRQLWQSSRHTPGVLFFALWAGMFTLPALLVHPESRALAIASIGWAYLLATLLAPRADAPASVPIWLRHGLLAANGIVSVCCAIGTVLVTNQMEQTARARMVEYCKAQPRPIRDGDELIIAEAASPYESICAGDRLELLTGRRDVAVTILTVPGTRAEVTRENDHTLLLRADSPQLFDSPAHRLTLGPDWQPKVGYTFQLRDFTVEIADLRSDGTVAALRLHFEDALDSPKLHFYPPTFAAIARGAAPRRGGPGHD
ncbi:MAG: hypothetical protein ACE5E1_01970 [Phycisphaerae bacterium]